MSDPYQFSNGVGFWPDPVPNGRTPQGGSFFDGVLEATFTNGSGEARMFRPRLARNEHGYLAPISSSPKKWRTYMYYNDAQINNPTDSCDQYGAWNASTGQWFSVSEIEITEQ